MVGDIEFLETVCKRMQQVGLVASKSEFSVTMLGKTPSYLTSMKARHRRVPDEVIAHLIEQFRDGISADDTALAELHKEIVRHECQRKHRADILEYMNRHMREKTSNSQSMELKRRLRPSTIARFLSAFDLSRFDEHGSATSG